MDAAAELGRNPVSKHQIYEPVSRDQILRRERGQGNINFPCSGDHVQDWQPYPVDPYSCYMCNHTQPVINAVGCQSGTCSQGGSTKVNTVLYVCYSKSIQ